MTRTMRNGLAGAVAALGVLAAADAAQAYGMSLEIQNLAEATLDSVLVRPLGGQGWEDVLYDRPTAPGEAVTVEPLGDGGCAYQMVLNYSDGTALDIAEVDFCTVHAMAADGTFYVTFGLA
jgi:hypothetical protein